MEIYLIRHGQTPWNAKGMLQGHVDIELNENGRQIAGELGMELENTDFDIIFSSPLIRAYETACLIRGHKNIKIERDDRLKEISFGEKEGITYKEWEAPESPQRFFFTEPKDYVPPVDGESFEQVIERTKSFLEEKILAKADEYKRVMIVGHGAVNKGLMCHIEGNDVEHFWGDGLQKNCAASIFTYDKENGWKRK